MDFLGFLVEVVFLVAVVFLELFNPDFLLDRERDEVFLTTRLEVVCDLCITNTPPIMITKATMRGRIKLDDSSDCGFSSILFC